MDFLERAEKEVHVKMVDIWAFQIQAVLPVFRKCVSVFFAFAGVDVWCLHRKSGDSLRNKVRWDELALWLNRAQYLDEGTTPDSPGDEEDLDVSLLLCLVLTIADILKKYKCLHVITISTSQLIV